MSEISTEFLREAFNRYLVCFESDSLEPTAGYLPYDFRGEINLYEWRSLGETLVFNELLELTNILNHWHGLLRSWHAWNKVLASYKEEISRNLQFELLEIEAVAHRCLLNPSAVKDAFTFVVTNAMHQVRLGLGGGYPDQLRGDPKPPQRPKYPGRTEKNQHMRGILSLWPEGEDFISTYEKINDKSYREITSNYRNRSSHAIGPCLGVGLTQLVTREVVSATELPQRIDGRDSVRPTPDTTMVRYGFGGTPPLDMEQTRKANLDQYLCARACYDRYRTLLSAGMSGLPRKT